MGQGKTTVTTLFKSASDTGAMANKVEGHEREIVNMTRLVDLLTCYIGD